MDNEKIKGVFGKIQDKTKETAKFVGNATKEKIKESVGDLDGDGKITVSDFLLKSKETAKNAGESAKKAGKAVSEKVYSVKAEDIIKAALKVPMVKVDRELFLKKELEKYCKEEQVKLAIEKNPAYAGVSREIIDKIAKQIIDYETLKVSSISFAAGLPGGWAMAATIPADIAQYFGFIVNVMQKLCYLYGFQSFDFSEDEVPDETMHEILIFIGVMMGVSQANQCIKIIAEVATKTISKRVAQKALTKGVVYPIVKKVATTIGFKMTKQVFADGLSKVVPVVGGVISGGITYLSFKPSSLKLMKKLQEQKLCDPEFYKEGSTISDDEINDMIVDITDDVEEIEIEGEEISFDE